MIDAFSSAQILSPPARRHPPLSRALRRPVRFGDEGDRLRARAAGFINSPTSAGAHCLPPSHKINMADSSASPLAQHLATIPELQVARGQFLYSSLPSRKEVNPTGYSGAISWWETTLASLVVKGLISEHKLILVVDENLREGLRYGKLGRPASLGAVLVSPRLICQV